MCAHGRTVAKLARAQERDLRAWLYADEPQPEISVASALRAAAAEVEDGHGVPVEVVTVGDTAATERMRPLVLVRRMSGAAALTEGRLAIACASPIVRVWTAPAPERRAPEEVAPGTDHAILYSTKEYKKIRLEFYKPEFAEWAQTYLGTEA